MPKSRPYNPGDAKFIIPKTNCEKNMRVSFDLDDTLFVDPEKFKTEKALPFPLRLIFRERLRLGTIGLFKYLNTHGVEPWVYTTSFRSERYIRGLFRCYGIKLREVVNGERHEREVQRGRGEALPSKYPGRYRIDLHIDDDISVKQNGDTYGFRVHIVGAEDDMWTEKIIAEIERISQTKKEY